MKNKEFTKVYEGLQSLIRVAMGDSVSNDTYFEFKKYFRYPGELLERMEQYGYGSADDYLSAIAALRWAKNRKLDISEMCVGTQLEDFLKKAEEKGKEENDLLLLYSVICYENDASVTYRYNIAGKEYESNKVQYTEKNKKGDKKEIRVKKNNPEVILEYNDINFVVLLDVVIGLCLELTVLCLYEMATNGLIFPL